jgi:putative addiction module killer protein
LRLYVTQKGGKPFIKWLESLKDKTVRYRIKERLDRLVLGNKGDYKAVGEGVAELRVNFGPGYRIYFGQVDERVILLLCGGNKSSQKRDIEKAINCWKDYLMR